ncbi:hypothetical protein FGU71_02965 [Erythrobacter insulae]|uniref:Uncharacterized protein n=1 Tax=Erythrobacter insulae TaxID=2584124 RepID=A0A547P9W2_9SPHN|nr:hypothetical protein [Erythrobacter insulae]TRD10920.1 hypothetical protein FGU71_02965 [Erythrobacter insulae]
MDWQDIALIAAGMIGSTVAIIHGVLVRRLMIRPLQHGFLADERTAPPVKKLVPLLLDFSAYNWLVGGIALIVAAIWLGQEQKAVAAVLVGSSYLYAAIGNFWGTRGRHFGWMLHAAALGLILFGIL